MGCWKVRCPEKQEVQGRWEMGKGKGMGERGKGKGERDRGVFGYILVSGFASNVWIAGPI